MPLTDEPSPPLGDEKTRVGRGPTRPANQLKKGEKIPTKRRSKYNVDLSPAGKFARTREGMIFASKREATHYDSLCDLRQRGVARWFVRQVPFHLPGGVIYRADFLVVWANGQITVEDVKGTRTEVYRLKRRQVKALYGIEITEC